jgi:hypothetical protein
LCELGDRNRVSVEMYFGGRDRASLEPHFEALISEFGDAHGGHDRVYL